MNQIEQPFALFAGSEWRGNGGIYDFRRAYSTLADAKEGGEGWYWYHVVDIRTMKVVAES